MPPFFHQCQKVLQLPRWQRRLHLLLSSSSPLQTKSFATFSTKSARTEASSSKASTGNVPQQPKAETTVELAFNAYKKLLSSAAKDDVEATNPLVIVHGLFGQKQNWRALARQLQAKLHNHVYTVDMRNHGESPHTPICTYPAMAADLDEFVRREVLPGSRFKTVFLMGHSMGGKVVAELALNAEMSKAIEKLIVVDVAPHRASSSTAFFDYVRALKAADLKLSRGDISRALKEAIPDDAVRTFLLTNLHKPRAGRFHWRCNLDAIEANLAHILGHKVGTTEEGLLKAIARPHPFESLFVSGELSTYLVSEDRPAIQQLFRPVQFREIAGAGHWVHSEKPEQFLKVVLDFLEHGYFTYG